MDKTQLQNQAEMYRYLYRTNQCTREEAQHMIQPYLDLVNHISIRIAQKYNQKPKLVHFVEYVR